MSTSRVTDIQRYSSTPIFLEQDTPGRLKHQFVKKRIKTSPNEKGEAYFCIINAKDSTLAKGFEGYRPFVRSESGIWFRVPEEGIFYNGMFFFSAPESCQYTTLFPGFGMNMLRRSLPQKYHGKKILPIIDSGNKRNPCVVIIARQRPGDVMTSYFVAGAINFLRRNLKRFSKKFRFIIVPMVCYSGVKADQFWVNSKDIYLPEDWNNTRSNEIAHLKKFLESAGIKNPFLFLEVAGSFRRQYNFAQYSNLRERHRQSIKKFSGLLGTTHPEQMSIFHVLQKSTQACPDNPTTTSDYMASLGFQTLKLVLSAHNNIPEGLYRKGKYFMEKLPFLLE